MQRLDQAMVARGLAPTRSRARDFILRGLVRVGGTVVTKPGHDVRDGAALELAAEARAFVSRGAEKLAAALDHFGFDPAGRIALDIGASTGGFTEVLLARGARRVWAIDVGHGQLHPALADDPRVVRHDGTDARTLTTDLVTDPIAAIVADVSFISLMKALPAALRLAAPGAWLVALVKPQFEAGPDNVGKGGIVRDAAVREKAVADVARWLGTQSGWRVLGHIRSPILGGSGNEEALLGARHD
ncbi:MAG: TlyA family RNA methyltransferase [Hyphomicrobiaceae bacterium]